MPIEKVDTLVVGAGQAGIAMSEHLTKNNTSHLVLERHKIAERWRSERWDSLVANGPAWHDRFPNLEFSEIGVADDAFPSKDTVADYLVSYAKKFDAPIRCGVEVNSVERNSGRTGFTIETSKGIIEATNIVAATGPFQTPVIPPVIPAEANFEQIHSSAYRNPEQLPQGAVMVIGAGSSGAQIAEELMLGGKRVYLSVGPHDRPPRSYRGRDFTWWLGVLGKWDIPPPATDTAHVTIAVSGARGGHTIDFRRFADEGMTLLGMTEKYENGIVKIAPDLAQNIAHGDASYLGMLNEADAYIERNGIDLPQETDAHIIRPNPECVVNPIREINLADAEITSIIWATGFTQDYSWLKVDAFDEDGKPNHQRGVSTEPGVYFLGLPWQSRRGSSFIWGVWHDAKFVADHIATQHTYLTYHQAALCKDKDA